MERYEVEEDARLAELVERAARGDEVVIVRGGRPVAKLAAEPGVEDRRRLRRETIADFAKLAAARGGDPIDGAALVRAARDAGY